ncbi:MAG: DUF1217 domain-containing protein, partial [Alphaproteobacteria bacterium]|nr:DUF1217 domain-containing protein [Alphaproteobacteria bacterium]
RFVQAFGSLNADHGAAIRQGASITAITSGFTAAQLQQSVGLQAEEVAANPGLASSGGLAIANPNAVAAVTAAFQSNRFRQSLAANAAAVTANASAGTLATIQLLGDRTLSAVTLGALGLPAETGALDPNQQIQILTNAGFDPKKLLDPKYLHQFIEQFLINSGQQQSAQGTDPASVGLAALTGITSGGGTDPGSVALTLLSGITSSGDASGGGNGTVPLDISFLAHGSSINLLA